LADPGALRAVLSAGIGLFAIALVGVALGAIIRHTAGAVAALPALIYLPLVALSLPVPWKERIGKLTMLMASYQLVSLRSQASVFSPLVSVLVLLAWPAVGLVVAAFLINRDAEKHVLSRPAVLELLTIDYSNPARLGRARA
jgi:hypothetical protein